MRQLFRLSRAVLIDHIDLVFAIEVGDKGNSCSVGRPPPICHARLRVSQIARWAFSIGAVKRRHAPQTGRAPLRAKTEVLNLIGGRNLSSAHGHAVIGNFDGKVAGLTRGGPKYLARRPTRKTIWILVISTSRPAHPFCIVSQFLGLLLADQRKHRGCSVPSRSEE